MTQITNKTIGLNLLATPMLTHSNSPVAAKPTLQVPFTATPMPVVATVLVASTSVVSSQFHTLGNFAN